MKIVKNFHTNSKNVQTTFANKKFESYAFFSSFGFSELWDFLLFFTYYSFSYLKIKFHSYFNVSILSFWQHFKSISSKCIVFLRRRQRNKRKLLVDKKFELFVSFVVKMYKSIWEKCWKCTKRTKYDHITLTSGTTVSRRYKKRIIQRV